MRKGSRGAKQPPDYQRCGARIDREEPRVAARVNRLSESAGV